MNPLFSPGSLVTVVGALLTVVGSIAYATEHPNLSLPTVFYGIPILLGGLALKSSELPPAQRLTPPDRYRELRSRPEQEALRKLLADVTRWRYGQKAHLETSLEALKLWDDEEPPQLLSIEELAPEGGYGLRLQFSCGAVAPERWLEKRERLGRFFAPDLRAEIEVEPGRGADGEQLLLSLLPSAATAASLNEAPSSP